MSISSFAQWLRNQALELDLEVNISFCHVESKALGRFVSLMVSQFPQLENKDDSDLLSFVFVRIKWADNILTQQ